MSGGLALVVDPQSLRTLKNAKKSSGVPGKMAFRMAVTMRQAKRQESAAYEAE